MIQLTSIVKKFGAALIIISAALAIWRIGAEIFGGGELTDIPFVLGMSSFGLIPGLLLYFTAKNVLKYGPNLGAGCIALLFSLPLLALAIGLQYVSSISILASISLALGAICIGLWGVSIIRAR